MVAKNKLISEMKDFNKELEKHLGSLGTDMLINKQITSNTLDNSNYSKEDLVLISSSLVDLRTELALMRKNFTNDIEQIVLHSVQEQQQIFMNSMKSFQSNLALEMKKNFGFEIKDILSELKELKTNNLKTQSLLEEKQIELDSVKQNQELLLSLIENSSLVQDFEFSKVFEDIKEMKHSVDFLHKNSSKFSNKIELNVSKQIKHIEELVENQNLRISNFSNDTNRIESNVSNQIKHIEELVENQNSQKFQKEEFDKIIENENQIQSELSSQKNLIKRHNKFSNKKINDIALRLDNQEKILQKSSKFLNSSQVGTLITPESVGDLENRFNEKLDKLILEKEEPKQVKKSNKKNKKIESIEKNLELIEKESSFIEDQNDLNQKFFDVDSKIKELDSLR